MATETFSLNSISRGSTRTRPNGSVRVVETRLGGSMAKRIEYCERGGSLASRADEVLWSGHAGPAVDWAAVDQREKRKDAQVGYELWCNVPHSLPLEAKQRIGQRVADHLSKSFGVPVHAALHAASQEGDRRNEHYHFPFPARSTDGKKLTALQKKTTSSQIVAGMRAFYQDTINAELQAAGINDYLDLRSRAARGLSEACKHIPKREFVRARRGEIVSKDYEHNQSLLARRAETAALAALANTTTQLATARATLERADLARAVNAGIFDAGVTILGAIIDRRGRYGTAVGGGMVRPEILQARPVAAGSVEDQQPRTARVAAADRDAGMAAGVDAPGRELCTGRANALPTVAPGAGVVGMENSASNEPADAARTTAAVGQPGANAGARPPRDGATNRMGAAPDSDLARGGSPAGRRADDGEAGRGEGGRRGNEADPSPATRSDGSRADTSRGPGGVRHVDTPRVIPQAQVQQPTATAPRSIWQQIVHVVSGEARREREAAEAQAQAQAQAEAERAAAEAARQREAQAAAEKQRRQEAFVANYRAKCAHAINAVAASQEPLIHFRMAREGPHHYAQREDWLAAWAAREDRPELVICDGQGEPLVDDAGDVRTVAIRDMEWPTMRAVAIQPVIDYALPPAQQERGQGMSL